MSRRNAALRTAPGFVHCQVQRRVVVIVGKLVPASGEIIEESRHWEDRKCGRPLNDHDRASGVCAPCRLGWYSLNSVPTERGQKMIDARRAELGREVLEQTRAVDRMFGDATREEKKAVRS